jgi:hypothetical protein
MASQIAHIVYAKKYFESIENEKNDSTFFNEKKLLQKQKINRDEFILGTVFPDIRMIEPAIKRKDTHLRFKSLDLDFSGLSSFEAGWKFHLYCDMRREEILNKKGFYNFKKTTDLSGRPAKLLEDALLYDTYNNWEKLSAYFLNPPIFQLDINVDRKTFVLWYAILAKYIKEKITQKTTHIFLSKQSTLVNDADEIIQTVLELSKNQKLQKILVNVKDEIIK